MTEYELRRAAAAAEQREQDRHAQYRADQQRRREEQFQAQRAERLATLRSALYTTFGATIEHELGGSYTVVGDPILMDVVYEVPVGDVVLRLRQVRDEGAEPWVCEAVARGTRVPVQVVPDQVEVNRDRLLLALAAVYGGAARSAEGRQMGGGCVR
jgi:hypothetical protein